MPSRDRRKRMFIEEFLNSRREESQVCDKTYNKYWTVLTKAVDALDEAGLEISPKKIGRNEILFLRQEVFNSNSSSHNRWQMAIFGAWLKWYDNRILEKMKLPWPQDNRINVDWLEPSEAIQLKASAKGIEKIVIHLELDLGLRRIDMHRLTMDSIHDGHFDVLGKGRGGGKKRTVSWDDETPIILKEFLEYRERIIAEARKKDPTVLVPDNLLIYRKGKRIGQYQFTAIDNMVIRVAKRAGIRRRITNHTLRRTCGRILHMSGVEIEKIADILGHSETRTTLRYLGLRLDDQKLAFTKKSEFLKKIELEMVKVD